MPYDDVANLVTNNDKYDKQNALLLWHPKNLYWENIAPRLRPTLCSGLSCSTSLPQTYPVVSAASKFDYPNSSIL